MKQRTLALVLGLVLSATAACSAVIGLVDVPIPADAGPDGALPNRDANPSSDGPHGGHDGGTRPDGRSADAHPMDDAFDAPIDGRYDRSAADAGHEAGHGDAGPVCVIDGTTYMPGQTNGSDTCQSCVPALSATGWTSATEGIPCVDAGTMYCHSGACSTGCVVAQAFYAPDAAQPSNLCETCQPATNTTALSPAPNGKNCGNGQTCENGMCGTNCTIDGGSYASGTLEPSNACESCQPGTSTTKWTELTNGFSCGVGEVCNLNLCEPGCFINNEVYSMGQKEPGDVCETCQPATSTTAWTAYTPGYPCQSDEICVTEGTQTVCESGCYIQGVFYPSGTSENPQTAGLCEVCTPSESTSMWTEPANGTVCMPNNSVCVNQVCEPGCYISGAYYAAGATAPGASCETCNPTESTSAWTTLAEGAACDVGGAGAGKCTSAHACQFTFTPAVGEQDFLVPAGVTTVTVVASGAAGGTACVEGSNTYGNEGSSLTATITVTPGQTLAIFVGGMGGDGGDVTEDGCNVATGPGAGGYNGGGAAGASGSSPTSYSAGGGGASDVRVGGNTLANRVLVAGGGGGGGGDTNSNYTGGPGSSSMGGTAGSGNGGGSGVAGTPGFGGMGGVGESNGNGGGGGGGGYYGGGGGGGSDYSEGGNGGDGSSYVVGTATHVTMSGQVVEGPGQVTITF